MSNLAVSPVERTREEILQAVSEFVQTSAAVVGGNNTYTALKTLTDLVNKSPETYAKIFKPEVIAEFQKLLASTEGKNVTMLSMLGKIGPILKHFNS